MAKRKSKEKAVKLLQQNTKPETVAEQTGYSIRRIYDFKKELRDTPEQPTAEKATSTALQLHPPSETGATTDLEDKLNIALDTLLQHLERDTNTTEVVEGIIKITEALKTLRTPPTNFAELINENTTHKARTTIHENTDAGQDPPTASADAENFVDILERTAGDASTTD